MQCTICKRIFTNKDNLEKHLVRHNEKKNHGCEKCGKKYKRLKDKERHQLICNGQGINSVVQTG